VNLAWHAAGVTAGALGALAAVSSCAGRDKPAEPARHAGAVWANSPPVCGVDQVREYFCDELVPPGSSLPPADPYGNCPRQIEHHRGDIEPRPPVAVFDRSYTDWTRRRAPPGHACCYSWCSPLELADPAAIDPTARCRDALSFREQYCIPELESGSRMPVGQPLARCAPAIQPPRGAVFSTPAAGALLDPAASWQRRQQGFADCCYAWCSLAPPNTGLQGGRR
jgi:hypothetical protein